MRYIDYQQKPPLDGWTPYFPKRRLDSVQGEVKAIVWHYTAGNLAGSLSRLRTEISAHFVVDRDGTVYQILDTEDAAWTQGVIDGNEKGHWLNDLPLNENLWCIGIEIINLGHAWRPSLYPKPEAYEPYTDQQMVACVELRDRLCAQFKIPKDRRHQVGHEELDTRKQDPGPRFPWMLITSNPETVPTPAPQASWEDAYHQLQGKFIEDLGVAARAVRVSNKLAARLGGPPADLVAELDAVNRHFIGRA